VDYSNLIIDVTDRTDVEEVKGLPVVPCKGGVEPDAPAGTC
jgi:hypothetical protein